MRRVILARTFHVYVCWVKILLCVWFSLYRRVACAITNRAQLKRYNFVGHILFRMCHRTSWKFVKNSLFKFVILVIRIRYTKSFNSSFVSVCVCAPLVYDVNCEWGWLSAGWVVLVFATNSFVPLSLFSPYIILCYSDKMCVCEKIFNFIAVLSLSFYTCKLIIQKSWDIVPLKCVALFDAINECDIVKQRIHFAVWHSGILYNLWIEDPTRLEKGLF